MAIGIIPARYGSTRFPGKPLALLAGKPLIAHVIHAAQKASQCTAVYVATDDARIAEATRNAGATALMTAATHATGTDRICEALAQIPAPADDIVVNIQGDEPFIDPAVIDACVMALSTTPEASWATAIYPLTDATEVHASQRVKVVCDTRGFALYFSRLPIPFARDGEDTTEYWGHIGLYAYRIPALRAFASAPPTPLEQAEKLEQLRALERGMRITCVPVAAAWPGVDTPEDLARVEQMYASVRTGE